MKNSRTSRILAIALVAVFGLPVLGLTWHSAGLAVRAHSLEQPYATAHACPADAGWYADCVQTVAATVAGPMGSATGAATHRLPLATAGGPRSAQFEGRSPAVRSVRDGDAVTLTVWRGVVQKIEDRGVVFTTAGVPATWFRRELAATTGFLAMSVLLPGTVLFFAASDERRRAARRKFLAVNAVTMATFVALMTAALGLEAGAPVTIIVAVAGAVEVVALAVVAWWIRRAILRAQGSSSETSSSPSSPSSPSSRSSF